MSTRLCFEFEVPRVPLPRSGGVYSRNRFHRFFGKVYPALSLGETKSPQMCWVEAGQKKVLAWRARGSGPERGAPKQVQKQQTLAVTSCHREYEARGAVPNVQAFSCSIGKKRWPKSAAEAVLT